MTLRKKDVDPVCVTFYDTMQMSQERAGGCGGGELAT